MAAPLVFADTASAADALTFARRATLLGEGAALRLQASGGVLVLSTAVLAPRGLLDATPTVLGMRTAAVDPELVCDLVIEAGLLGAGDSPDRLRLPESGLSVGWAGVAPPRSGWERADALSASEIAETARRGGAEVANETAGATSEEALRTVRARVWGAPEPRMGGLPRGAAFAASTLGFLAGAEEVPVFTAPRWARLTFARGHVLVRVPPRGGMTPVRATG